MKQKIFSYFMVFVLVMSSCIASNQIAFGEADTVVAEDAMEEAGSSRSENPTEESVQETPNIWEDGTEEGLTEGPDLGDETGEGETKQDLQEDTKEETKEAQSEEESSTEDDEIKDEEEELESRLAGLQAMPALLSLPQSQILNTNGWAVTFIPDGDTIMAPDFPDRVKYSLSYQAPPSDGNPYALADNFSFVSHSDDSLILKELYIGVGPGGNTGISAGLSTYDLYINGELEAEDVSTGVRSSFRFDDGEHRQFEIRLEDGTSLMPGIRLTGGCVEAVYEIADPGDKVNLINYIEIKYNMDGVEYSSLDTNVDSNTFPLQILSSLNEAEYESYQTEEDVVFELSEFNFSKFVGDHAYVYLWMDNSIGLENYFIKKLEFNWFDQPEIPGDSSMPRIQMNTDDGTKVAEMKMSSGDTTAIWENTAENVDVTRFKITDTVIRPDRKFISDGVLDDISSDYELADHLGGCSLKGLSIKITYGQKPGKAVTTDTDFDNILFLNISPTNNPNDYVSVRNTITGSTLIEVPKAQGTLSATKYTFEGESVSPVFTNDDFSYTLKSSDGKETTFTLNSSSGKNNKTMDLEVGEYTLTERPKDGYQFLNYTVDGGDPVSQNTATLTVTKDRTTSIILNSKRTAVNPDPGDKPDPDLPTDPETKPETAPETKPGKPSGGGDKPDYGKPDPTTSPTVSPTPEGPSTPESVPETVPNPEQTPGTGDPQRPLPDTPGFQNRPDDDGDIVQREDGIYYFISPEGVPLAYFDPGQDRWVTIADGEIPYASLPVMGDSGLAWLWLTLMSIGAIGIVVCYRKKKCDK